MKNKEVDYKFKYDHFCAETLRNIGKSSAINMIISALKESILDQKDYIAEITDDINYNKIFNRNTAPQKKKLKVVINELKAMQLLLKKLNDLSALAEKVFTS